MALEAEPSLAHATGPWLPGDSLRYAASPVLRRGRRPPHVAEQDRHAAVIGVDPVESAARWRPRARTPLPARTASAAIKDVAETRAARVEVERACVARPIPVAMRGPMPGMGPARCRRRRRRDRPRRPAPRRPPRPSRRRRRRSRQACRRSARSGAARWRSADDPLVTGVEARHEIGLVSDPRDHRPRHREWSAPGG